MADFVVARARRWANIVFHHFAVLPGALRLGPVRASDAVARTAVPTGTGLRLTLGRGGAVEGVVLDPEGTPLEAARVAPMGALDVPMIGDVSGQIGLDLLANGTRDGVTTDADGRFRLTGLHGEAPFHVVATHDDYSPGIARKVRVGEDVLEAIQRTVAEAAAELAAQRVAPHSLGHRLDRACATWGELVRKAVPV